MTLREELLRTRYNFENPFVTDPAARKAARYLHASSVASSGRKLLDVGCGEGADSVFYAGKGFHVTAIDKDDASLERFRLYRRDHGLSTITILRRDARSYGYRPRTYDVISCLLVLCCMRRSDFERFLVPLKRAVKPGGIVIMSARNYLDPEFKVYRKTARMIEPHTFPSMKERCGFLYFIEKGRLRELFSDFEILSYFEGFAPCKYHEHPVHGDSTIICRRPPA